jgi:phage tail-like protein
VSENDYSNDLRVDLYKLLLPEIKEEDQTTGTSAFLDTYDDPQAEIYAWDQTAPFQAVWDRLGLRPVIQRLYWCLEKQHGDMLEELEAIPDLNDPDTVPARFLDYMAVSLGYPLDDSMSEAQKRATIRGIMTAYKEHGTPLSWTVFYRMINFRILYYPLWKKEYAEDQDRYARERYETTTPFGPIVITPFTPSLPQAPLLPTSLRMTDGVEVIRDDGRGNLVGTLGGTGTVNYLTGAMQVNFAPPGPVGPINLTGESVDEEYPYHAARVDFDFFLVPIGGGAPPTVNDEFIKKVLTYLEEVRPIHVILRTFNLIMPIEEELENFVADSGCCGPSMGKDETHGDELYYAADLGPFPEDSSLVIDTQTVQRVQLDEITPFIHPLLGDELGIVSVPPQPFDGKY